jgi:AraC-like DNA-binding protein
MHPIYDSEFVAYSAVNGAHWHVPPHAHQCYELLYVLEGRCQIETESGTDIAEPHNLVLFRPYQRHEELNLTDAYAVLCLRFPGELVAEHRVPLPGPAELPTVTQLPPTPEFRTLLDAIIAEHQGHDSYSVAMIGTYLFQFAVLLRRVLGQRPDEATPGARAQVAGLRRLLDKHITSAASIRDMARQVHMSESHFSHQVKALLGVAPKTYVREQRIARAVELLRSTDLSVEEIAVELGYDAPTSFFRAFKRSTGRTPGSLRVQHRHAAGTQECNSR